MRLIEWLIDNSVWLMLAANVFSLIVGYSLGSARGQQAGEQDTDRRVSPRVSEPNNRSSGDA